MNLLEVITVHGRKILVHPDAPFREPDGVELLGGLEQRQHDEVRPGRLARDVKSVSLEIQKARGAAMPDMLMVEPAAYLTVSQQALGELDRRGLCWDPDLIRIPATVTWRRRTYPYVVLFPSRRYPTMDLDRCELEFFRGTTAIKTIRRHAFRSDLPQYDLIHCVEASEWYCTDNWREGWTGASLTGLQFHPL